MTEEKFIEQRVFDAIASGRVKMRSRAYFVLQTILAIVGGVIMGLFLIYIGGFILFLLIQSGAIYAPGLGISGWYIFLRSLPWLLILLSLVFLLVLVILINHFSFAYQRPLLYSLLGILILVVGASFTLAFTPFNTAFLGYNNAPIIGGYYSNYGAGELTDIHRGEVIALAENGFILEGVSGETSTVLFDQAIATMTQASLHAGDLVVVFGDRDQNGFIDASAIDRIGP
ncbi:MAG TPA: hypothetical protein VMU07_02115 [Candidatus Paceibacterota bacterium]|nr:hypothetical protein [Candidatus Paceibacterota bacterium]